MGNTVIKGLCPASWMILLGGLDPACGL